MEIIGRKKICLAYFRSRNVEYKQKKIRRKNSGTLEKNSKIKYFDSTIWPKITQKRLNKCERNFTIR